VVGEVAKHLGRVVVRLADDAVGAEQIGRRVAAGNLGGDDERRQSSEHRVQRRKRSERCPHPAAA
jgi:hypothetical protein